MTSAGLSTSPLGTLFSESLSSLFLIIYVLCGSPSSIFILMISQSLVLPLHSPLEQRPPGLFVDLKHFFCSLYLDPTFPYMDPIQSDFLAENELHCVYLILPHCLFCSISYTALDTFYLCCYILTLITHVTFMMSTLIASSQFF